MAFLPIFDALSPVISKFLSFIPDPEQKLKAQMEIMASLQSWDAQQNQINMAEAQNPSLWVSGARPFILWVCGFAFAYKFVLQPFMIFLLVAIGSKFDYRLLPVLDWAEMSPVLFGLLGMGALRSWDKKNGIY